MEEKNSFIKKYIIFVLLLVIVTVIAIVLTINSLNKTNKNEAQNENIENIVEAEKAKNKAEDEKYSIKKYSETYNENDIKILNYIDVDGNVDVYDEKYKAPDGKKRIEFLQIDGLKNKTVQNKVNEKIKNECYNMKTQNVYTNITANYSNILSLVIVGSTPNVQKDEIVGLNIDLSSGENIPFEKVFVSSAPINSYLTEGLYKTLAWDARNQNVNENNYSEDFDMSKADTSEYEDKSILLVNNYKKAKKEEKLQYCISPSGVTLYNLLDTKIVSKDFLNASIEIEFKNKIEEVAIYKRYLTDTSIFENNNIGLKNVAVLTNPLLSYEVGLRKMFKILNYEKISNNIFMEDAIENLDLNPDEGYKKIIKYFQTSSDETKRNLKVDSGKGMFYQRTISIYKEPDEKCYIANIMETKTTCDENYFDNFAFKDYIDMKNRPTAGPAYFIFYQDEYEQKQYPNLSIKTNRIKDGDNYTFPKLYFDLEGNYLGTTKEEAKAKTEPKEIETTPKQDEVITNKEQNNNNQEKNENILGNNTNINTNNNIQENNVTNSVNSENSVNTLSTKDKVNNKTEEE